MSTQFTAGVRQELAEAFDLPLDNVRVIVDGMGGGFGSKSSLGNYGRIAVATVARGRCAGAHHARPRQEEQMDAGNRPATWQRLRIGAQRDGSLTAISLESYGTAGVGARRRRRQFRPGDLCLPELSNRRNTMCSSMPGRAAPCAPRAIRRAPSGSNKRSTNSPSGSASIRSRLRDRIDPSPVTARGAAHRRRADRLAPAPRARRRPRPGQARPRHGAIALGGQCPDQFRLRSARDARRLGRGSLGRAGHRDRHRHDHRPGRRRGAGAAARGYHGAHRRHRISRRAALLRQPDDRLDHAAGAHRRLASPADAVSRGGARA